MPVSSRRCSSPGHTARHRRSSSAVVPVDLVTLAEKTNVAPMVKKTSEELPLLTSSRSLPQPCLRDPAAATKVEVRRPTRNRHPVVKPPPKQKKHSTSTTSRRCSTSAWRRPETAKAGRPQRQGHRRAIRDDRRSARPCCLMKSANAGVRRWARRMPRNLIVDFRCSLNPDGSVAQPPQLTADSQRPQSAAIRYMRAAADAARARHLCLRAVPIARRPV